MAKIEIDDGEAVVIALIAAVAFIFFQFASCEVETAKSGNIIAEMKEVE